MWSTHRTRDKVNHGICSSCQWNKWITTTLQKIKKKRPRQREVACRLKITYTSLTHLNPKNYERKNKTEQELTFPTNSHVHSPLQIGSAFVFCVTNYESQFVLTSNGNNESHRVAALVAIERGRHATWSKRKKKTEKSETTATRTTNSVHPTKCYWTVCKRKFSHIQFSRKLKNKFVHSFKWMCVYCTHSRYESMKE